MIYFILGLVVGVLLSILNILAYKREVQTRIKKFTSGKAAIIDTTNYIAELDLTE
jgi:sensor domain CHASE-containing protein